MTSSVPGALWALAVRIARAVTMAEQGPKELSFGSWEQVKTEGTGPCPRSVLSRSFAIGCLGGGSHNCKPTYYCIPRYGHACAVVGNQMYMFAGASEDSGTVKYFSDLHILHCEFSWDVCGGCLIPILFPN